MFVVASQNWFTHGLSHRLICLFKARWRQLERKTVWQVILELKLVTEKVLFIFHKIYK